MDNSLEQLYNNNNQDQQDRFKLRLNEFKLFLLGIWNPTKAERLTIEEFQLEHRNFLPQVATVWRVKMIVIIFNIFTCLIFTINFGKPSYFLTSLLSISIPFADKYTWLRYIINGFITNDLKYFNYFLITFGFHMLLFLAWTTGLLWNSIGWYLLLIDSKNYGLLNSFLIVFNSMLLSVYLFLVCGLYFKLVKHIRTIKEEIDGRQTQTSPESGDEFQRLINNGFNEV